MLNERVWITEAACIKPTLLVSPVLGDLESYELGFFLISRFLFHETVGRISYITPLHHIKGGSCLHLRYRQPRRFGARNDAKLYDVQPKKFCAAKRHTIKISAKLFFDDEKRIKDHPEKRIWKKRLHYLSRIYALMRPRKENSLETRQDVERNPFSVK